MEEKIEVRLIAVIGAGAMGSGIAQVAATSGFRVNLSDVSAAVLEKALVSIRKSLARLVKAGTLTETQAAGALSRIAASASTIRIRPLVIFAAARQARGTSDPVGTVG